MEDNYVPCEMVLVLKELGFYGSVLIEYDSAEIGSYYKQGSTSSEVYDYQIKLPYYQAFKWFREEHDLHGWCEKQHKDVRNKYGYRVGKDVEHSTFTYNDWSYEQAELECLKDLIKILQKKKTR